MVKPKPIPHGTTTAYNRDKCRCDECRLASRNYQRKRRGMPEWQPKSPPEHGTTARYAAGCRCRECTSAASAYSRENKRKRRADLAGVPIQTEKYRDLVEKALGAFSLDPDYVVRMCQAAASAKP